MNSFLGDLIGLVLRIIPADMVKTSVGAFINHIEDRIKNDGVQNWKDSAVLPLLEEIKKQLGIVTPKP